MTSKGEDNGEQDAAVCLQPLRIGVLVVSALVAASALWGVWDAVGREPQVWALLGFEIVTFVAGVLGVLVGLGRFREAPALSVFAVAGTVFASAMLGRFSAIVTRSADAGSGVQAVRQMLKDPMFDGRMLAVGAFGVLALCLAFGRDRRSWRTLASGIVLAGMVLASLAWAMGAGRAWLLAPVETAVDVARVIGSLLGGLVVVVLAAVAVHLVVRSFELRLPPLGVARGGGGARGGPPRKTPAATPKKSV